MSLLQRLFTVIEGLGSRVWGLGSRVWGLGSGVWGLGSRGQVYSLRIFLARLRRALSQDKVRRPVPIERDLRPPSTQGYLCDTLARADRKNT